jgi:hypothetical protein
VFGFVSSVPVDGFYTDVVVVLPEVVEEMTINYLSIVGFVNYIMPHLLKLSVRLIYSNFTSRKLRSIFFCRMKDDLLLSSL